jgi:hypothetical protein
MNVWVLKVAANPGLNAAARTTLVSRTPIGAE